MSLDDVIIDEFNNIISDKFGLTSYYETDYFKETNYAVLSSEDDIYVWSDVFVKYWKNNFKDELKRIKNLDDLSTTLVYIILYEELSCFSNFYEKEMFPGK